MRITEMYINDFVFYVRLYDKREMSVTGLILLHNKKQPFCDSKLMKMQMAWNNSFL